MYFKINKKLNTFYLKSPFLNQINESRVTFATYQSLFTIHQSNMAFKDFDDLPISWGDHEDIAMKLYERFGEEFNEGKIYRIRFTELLQWILEIPTFEGKKEDSSEGHLEQIQAKWVYEWRDNNR